MRVELYGCLGKDEFDLLITSIALIDVQFVIHLSYALLNFENCCV